MIMSPQLWIVLRALVMLLVSWGIASYDTSKSNIDWVASLIVSIAGGLAVFLWLLWNERVRAIDWSKPASITQPFFPMNQYPVRYWIVVAVSLILGGSAALTKEIAEGGQHVAFGALFLLLGAAILAAIGVLMRMREGGHRQGPVSR